MVLITPDPFFFFLTVPTVRLLTGLFTFSSSQKYWRQSGAALDKMSVQTAQETAQKRASAKVEAVFPPKKKTKRKRNKKHQFLMFVQVSNSTRVCFPQELQAAVSKMTLWNIYSYLLERHIEVVSYPGLLSAGWHHLSVPSKAIQSLLYVCVGACMHVCMNVHAHPLVKRDKGKEADSKQTDNV